MTLPGIPMKLTTLLLLTTSTALATAAQDSAPSMKAIRFHEFGGAEVLKLEEVPKPEAKAGEVLVRVHAAGVNPIDWKLRAGHIQAMVKLPQIPGFDIAGVVEARRVEWSVDALNLPA